MPNTTYKEVRDRLRKRLWPSGEPRNLREIHNDFFLAAMNDLQRWVTCLRDHHVDLYKACSTLVQCAKTIVDAPLPGTINRVYTIANNEWCDPVHYTKVPYHELVCLARNTVTGFEAPANIGMSALQQGFKHAEASTDSTCGRARIGVYAIHNERLYLFPWIQSNETVVVEWDGWKTQWNEEDQLDEELWDIKAIDAIGFHVRMRHEDEYGSATDATAARRNYNDARAELMYWCEERKRTEDQQQCSDPRLPTSAEYKDDEVPVVSDEYNFAIIGDYGQNTVGESQVAALVKTWSPSDIFANGDCDYIGDYDVSNGQYYHEYIYPYSGAFGSGAADGANHFWPAPANHDWDADGPGATTLAKYLAFFDLPGNERYYEVVRGPVHFFMCSSDAREPDGRTSTPISKQAEWLKVKMLLSTAKWKVVLIHDPPYTSGDDYPGHTFARWPFKDWGADIVISADSHQYERISVDGLPYLVNGAGGATIDTTFNDPPTTGSLFRYGAKHGALKCKGTCSSLKFEFYNVDGTLIDTLELTK